MVCVASWAAVVFLAVGLVLLLAELSNPLRGMMMWQSFSNLSSWMAIGAWVLAIAMAVFGIMAILSTPAISRWLAKEDQAKMGRVDGVRRVLAVVGIVFAVALAAYTGILLMVAPGVPLWGTFLLPCLFVISGVDTGIAFVEVIATLSKDGVDEASSRLMSRSVVVLVIAELIVLTAFWGLAALGGPFASASAGLIAGGALTAPFWILVVAAGLLLPLVVAVVQLRRVGARHQADGGQAKPEAHSGRGVALVGACGALVGGCALRFIVLFAGTHGDILGALVSTL